MDWQNTEKWFRFDDEDVSVFSPEQIATQCFGGPPESKSSNNYGNSSNSNFDQEDRTSNALMLFYTKVKPISQNFSNESASIETTDVETQNKEENKEENKETSKLVDGVQAFIREVNEWNLQHLFSRYMLDPDLHSFVRSLLSSLVNSSSTVVNLSESSKSLCEIDSEIQNQDNHERREGSCEKLNWFDLNANNEFSSLPLKVSGFGYKFLLDVVLHCRERGAIRAWEKVLRRVFDTFPKSALSFLYSLVFSFENNWFEEYLLHCSDTLSRIAFVQIVTQAVLSLSPLVQNKSIDMLIPLLNSMIVSPQISESRILELSLQEETDLAILCFAKLTQKVLEFVLQAPSHIRVADEVFALLREVSAVPCIAYALIMMRSVSFLSFFAFPDVVSDDIKSMFENSKTNKKQTPDFTFLLQSVFEALAALLGVPQLRKVNLLMERTTYDVELVSDARDAFSIIFNENCNKNGMDLNDFVNYKEKLGTKITGMFARDVFSRCHTTENRLTVDGFIQYYAELANQNPKEAWKDLHFFNFKHDLSRATENYLNSDGQPFNNNQCPALPDDCNKCLSTLSLLLTGLQSSEASVKAIIKRLCTNNEDYSKNMISQVLDKLRLVAPEYSWGNALSQLTEILKVMLSVEDDLLEFRLQNILLCDGLGLCYLTATELLRPNSRCKANNDNNNNNDKKGLFKRYMSVLQDLTFIPKVKETLNFLAEHDQNIRFIKGFLKKNDSQFTDNDEYLITNTKVHVENAGTVEVNGVYEFKGYKCNAGWFTRVGVHHQNNSPVNYNLYKCAVQNNSFQWFISITPEGMEPGTKHDTDFYYSIAKTEVIPPTNWNVMNNNYNSKNPIPNVFCESPELMEIPVELILFETGAVGASDSDRDDSSSPQLDDDLNEESYNSFDDSPGE